MLLLSLLFTVVFLLLIYALSDGERPVAPHRRSPAPKAPRKANQRPLIGSAKTSH